MKIRLVALLSLLLGTPTLRADEGWFSAILVGRWRNSKTGDVYQFRSDGGYTFFSGSAKRKSGNVSHSGRWRTFNPDPNGPDTEPSEWGLKLHARKRTVLEAAKLRELNTNTGFTFRFSWPGPPDEPVNVVRIGKERFVKLKSAN